MPNETQMLKRTFKVPAENLDRLHDQISVVNRRVERLRKLGYDAEPVSISEGPAYFVKKGMDSPRAYVDVEIRTWKST